MRLNLEKFLTYLNSEIKEVRGKDYTIGHAYFMRLAKVPQERRAEAFVEILKSAVLPLLQEYFYDDWDKLIEILNPRRKSEVEEYLIDRFGEIKVKRENTKKIVKLLAETVNPETRGEEQSQNAQV
jgi:hypothetical protein